MNRFASRHPEDWEDRIEAMQDAERPARSEYEDPPPPCVCGHGQGEHDPVEAMDGSLVGGPCESCDDCDEYREGTR